MNLVERLRNDIQQWGDFGTLKSEAAAEIERLQAFKDSIIDNSDEYKKVLADNERLRGERIRLAEENMDLQQDNQRLRGALKEYGLHLTDCPKYSTLGTCECGLSKALEASNDLPRSPNPINDILEPRELSQSETEKLESLKIHKYRPRSTGGKR
jgi:hypothetical protein